MRKTIIFSLAIFLCGPLSVWAVSIGGVETQGQGKFSIGLDQEFVFDREQKFDDSSAEVEPGQELDADIENMYRIMIKVNYGLFDSLDVYVKLGAADAEVIATDYIPEEWNLKDTFKTDCALSYGIGLKGIYGLEYDWLIGLDIQYLRHKNDYSLEGLDQMTGVVDAGEGKMTFQEWHIAPYIAKKIKNFTPYLGAKYSEAKTKERTNDTYITTEYKADDNVGVFFGVDYRVGKSWRLNLEGRLIDEMAMSFAINYKF